MNAEERPVPEAVLTRFDPHPDRLLDYLRAQVDDEMLQEMAESDCGLDNAPAQFAALKHIRDTGQVPAPMEWEPGEALNLTSHGWWTIDHKFASQEELLREHWVRAFACVSLLRASAMSANSRIMSAEHALPGLILSALALGEEVESKLAGFLAWRVTQAHHCSRSPYYALSVLVLEVLSRSPRRPESELAVLCDWVVEDESARQRINDLTYRPGHTRRRMAFDVSRDCDWKALLERTKEHLPGIANERLRTQLSELVDRIV